LFSFSLVRLPVTGEVLMNANKNISPSVFFLNELRLFELNFQREFSTRPVDVFLFSDRENKFSKILILFFIVLTSTYHLSYRCNSHHFTLGGSAHFTLVKKKERASIFLYSLFLFWIVKESYHFCE
jgi:hypothetical protein